jgi:hypothetical protein
MRGLLSKDKALRMDGDGNVDEVLLRFLRVMKFNVTKAAARYVAHWDAREEWGYGPAPLTYSALPDDVKKATSLGFLQVPFGPLGPPISQARRHPALRSTHALAGPDLA